MHFDSRLNWKHHVCQKTFQIKEDIYGLYWLVGPRLDPANKRLHYDVAIIKPIWTCSVQLWGVVPANPTSKIFNVVKISPYVPLYQQTGSIGTTSEDIIRPGRIQEVCQQTFR